MTYGETFVDIKYEKSGNFFLVKYKKKGAQIQHRQENVQQNKYTHLSEAN